MRALLMKAIKLLAGIGLNAQVGFIYTGIGKATVVLALDGISKKDLEKIEETK